MPYIIDGHNLIPRIPGLDLASVDDEVQLIELVQEFCRLRRKSAEIYFDNAPPGQPKARHYGQVLARFVRAGQTADDAIRARLLRLGPEARNWAVVTSDQQVQLAVRAARAQSISSDAFARLLVDTLRAGENKSGQEAKDSLGEGEIQEWLDIFTSGGDRPEDS
jgi:predicted RNA-binding protein with PIN domain